MVDDELQVSAGNVAVTALEARADVVLQLMPFEHVNVIEGGRAVLALEHLIDGHPFERRRLLDAVVLVDRVVGVIGRHMSQPVLRAIE